jgi:hypothetical protein
VLVRAPSLTGRLASAGGGAQPSWNCHRAQARTGHPGQDLRDSPAIKRVQNGLFRLGWRTLVRSFWAVLTTIRPISAPPPWWGHGPSPGGRYAAQIADYPAHFVRVVIIDSAAILAFPVSAPTEATSGRVGRWWKSRRVSGIW